MPFDLLHVSVFLAIRFTVAAVVVLPITYFVHGLAGFGAAVLGLVVGSLIWFRLLREQTLVKWQLLVLYGVVDAIFGLSYGLLIPTHQNPSAYNSAVQLIIGSFCAALALVWVVQVIDPSRAIIRKIPGLFVGPLGITFSLGILFPMLPSAVELKQLTRPERLGVGLLLIAGGWVGIKCGAWLGRLTRVLATSGKGVVSEVRTLGAAGVFFLIGYFLITLLYSTIYAAIWRANNAAFSGDGFPNDPTFFDFLYFSIVTIATLGYGDVFPKSTIARGTAMTEVLLGVAWVTVVLAATVARLSSPRSNDSSSS